MSPLTEPTRIVLKNYNTPAAIAGVAPTLDYRFALDRRELDAVSLTDKLTVTRAATAAVNGSTGYLELAGPNVARFDHNLSTRKSQGLLVEEESENKTLQSQNFTSASWVKLQATITPSAILAPDASLTASKLSATTNNSFGLVKQTVTVSSGTITGSVFAKKGEFDWLLLKQDSGTAPGSAYRSAWFNLSDGNIGVVESGLTAFISTYENGWHRCSISYSLTGSGTTEVTSSVASTDNTNAVSGADGIKGIYIWGAQVEQGTITSYTPTTSSTVTRTESATIDGTGVITGTYTMVEKPAGCAVVNGTNIDLQTGYTAERVMVFPAALSGAQITAIRSAM